MQRWIALKNEIGKQFYQNLFTLLSRDLLLLLLSFAELKVISSDSSTHNVVVSSIFIFISWVYPLRPVDMNIQNKDLYLLQSMIYHEKLSNFDGIFFSVLLSSWTDQETTLVSFE